MKSYDLPARPASSGQGHSETRSLDQILPKARLGDPDACGDLYTLTNKGVRLILRRNLGHDDVEPLLQEVYAELFRGIRVGLVPNPASLGAFLRDIVHAHIAHATAAPDSEPGVPLEQAERMHRTLARLSSYARQLLDRYILKGESPEHLCEEGNLSRTQFRAIVNNAKTLFSQGTAASNHKAAGV